MAEKLRYKTAWRGAARPQAMTAPADPAAAAVVVAAPAVSGKRILVVDDKVDAAHMPAMFLESSGHEVPVEYGPASACSTSACPTWTARNWRAACASRPNWMRSC